MVYIITAIMVMNCDICYAIIIIIIIIIIAVSKMFICSFRRTRPSILKQYGPCPPVFVNWATVDAKDRELVMIRE
jgi:hypothetical protein